MALAWTLTKEEAATMKTTESEDALAEARDEGFVEGERRAVINMLRHFASGLHVAGLGTEARAIALDAERLEAVSALRELCAEHGDNDWPDDLHLRDIIEKHLGRHLDSDD